MKRNKSIKSLVQAYKPGAMKISEYCDKHGFTVASFYYWQRKLTGGELSDFVTIEPIREGVPSIHLRMPSGIEVHLSGMGMNEIMKWTLEIDQVYAEL